MSDDLARLRRLLEGRPRVRIGPPLDAPALEALESELGVSLPEPYRDILAEIGPFSDDTGFCLEAAKRPPRPGEFEVSAARVLAFARERIAAARADPSASSAFDSVRGKRLLSYGMLGAWEDVESDGPGLVRIAPLACVSADLYLVVRGELRGTVWFDGDPGFHPEFRHRDGEVVLHDPLSWALSFGRD